MSTTPRELLDTSIAQLEMLQSFLGEQLGARTGKSESNATSDVIACQEILISLGALLLRVQTAVRPVMCVKYQQSECGRPVDSSQLRSRMPKAAVSSPPPRRVLAGSLGVGRCVRNYIRADQVRRQQVLMNVPPAIVRHLRPKSPLSGEDHRNRLVVLDQNR